MDVLNCFQPGKIELLRIRLELHWGCGAVSSCVIKLSSYVFCVPVLRYQPAFSFASRKVQEKTGVGVGFFLLNFGGSLICYSALQS